MYTLENFFKIKLIIFIWTQYEYNNNNNNKLDFCKTFRIKIIINTIITPFVLYQMRWLDGDGLSP